MILTKLAVAKVMLILFIFILVSKNFRFYTQQQPPMDFNQDLSNDCPKMSGCCNKTEFCDCATYKKREGCICVCSDRLNSNNKTKVIVNVNSTENIKVKHTNSKFKRASLVHQQCTAVKTISLTYDDGPSNLTLMILDILKYFNVKATFFVWGAELESNINKEILKRVYADGHIVGSHVYSHPDLTKVTAEQIKQEMLKTSKIIHDIIGVHPRYMRPPYGYINRKVIRQLHKMGYEVFLWNMDPRDWQHCEKRPSNVFNTFVKHLKQSNSSFIVLQHDIHNCTANQQYKIIDFIKKNNYAIIPLNDCIGDAESPYYHQLQFT